MFRYLTIHDLSLLIICNNYSILFYYAYSISGLSLIITNIHLLPNLCLLTTIFLLYNKIDKNI